MVPVPFVEQGDESGAGPGLSRLALWHHIWAANPPVSPLHTNYLSVSGSSLTVIRSGRIMTISDQGDSDLLTIAEGTT